MIYNLYSNKKDFFYYAFKRNQWLWFHMLASLILCKFLNQSIYGILYLSVFWEILEFAIETSQNFSSYGGIKRSEALKYNVSRETYIERLKRARNNFLKDSAGDILGAVLIAIVYWL